MRSAGNTKFALALAGLTLGMLMLATPMGAQPAATTGRGTVAPYDLAHEVTINGTIAAVVTKHTMGSPAGMHLLVAGAQGTVDAHIGFIRSKSERAALHTGLPIQIVGAVKVLNGKQYLFARELHYGGRTIAVRSKTGFPTGGLDPSRPANARALKAARSAKSGGAQ
jgi:hypothetical protein